MFQSLTQTFERYRTLRTHRITALPIVILMPHSSCNCRCVMCDIWKDNKNLKQLTEDDVKSLLSSLHKFRTQQVVMSGGEALLNSNFFRLCEILRRQRIDIVLLSTGLTLKRHTDQLLKWVKEIIVSLDGGETVHDQIRNIPGAFQKLTEGVRAIKAISPSYRITTRTVIHKLNFRCWPEIIDAAREMGADQVSFLPADVSSQAFNREVTWPWQKQQELLLNKEELSELQEVMNDVLDRYRHDFETKFIAESPGKLQMIYQYYSAFFDNGVFPFKKCNAPWVSTVIEADGSVRPCFFHDSIGNIKEDRLDSILNSEKAITFRRELDISANATCKKCVCYLNLPPHVSLKV